MRSRLLTVFCLFIVMVHSGICARPDPKCLLPMETGPCRMKLVRYYFDAATKSCKTFSYGGCKGNDNKFGTLSSCEITCNRS